jgi:hypothetical protein
METLIEHLSAEQVDKDTHATKKNGQAQEIELEAGSKGKLASGECIEVPAMDPNQFVILEKICNVILTIGVLVKDKTVFFPVASSGALPVRFTELLDDLLSAESGCDSI